MNQTVTTQENDGSNPSIIISNINSPNSEETESENIKLSYRDGNGTEIFSFERPEAELNIFDSQYYIDSNPDIAEEISDRYQGTTTRTVLDDANLPNINPTDPSQLQNLDGMVFGDGNITSSFANYGGAIEDYVTGGAAEGRDPSPLFNSEYYLEQNPDVAIALAGGDFRGDPLLHYVETGAAEGRDPNAYFDSDYYLEQNPGVVETGLNPLEHYVLLGSSSGADPSANFDPDFYLNQNQDVANAGINPLTHFLTAGQDEGRLPIAE